MMKSVVTSVVTSKSKLTTRNHCENPINGGRRVEDLPLYITNRKNCEYSQVLTLVFRVTTEVTTVSNQNHSLEGHYHEKNQLYQEEPCTSARVVTVRQFMNEAKEISIAEMTMDHCIKNQTRKEQQMAGKLVKEVLSDEEIHHNWHTLATWLLLAEYLGFAPQRDVGQLKEIVAANVQQPCDSDEEGDDTCEYDEIDNENREALRKVLKDDNLTKGLAKSAKEFLDPDWLWQDVMHRWLAWDLDIGKPAKRNKTLEGGNYVS